MKGTSTNILLALFLITLISFSMSLKSHNHNSMLHKIASSLSDEPRKNVDTSMLPTFKNKGFKCLKIDFNLEKSNPLDAKACATEGETCTSKGVVIYMADGKFDIIVQNEPEHILCDKKNFKLQNTSKGVCFTQNKVKNEYEENELIPEKFSSGKFCKYHKASIETEFLFLTQEESRKCSLENDEKLKKNFVKLAKPTGSAAPGKECVCYAVNIPKVALKSPYLPIRFNGSNFECLGGGNSGCGCKGSFDKNTCLELTQNINNTCIKTLPERYYSLAYDFFFGENKWICPSVSGLQVAIKVEKPKDNEIKISCLGKTGNDCYYDENAEMVCQQVNRCTLAAKEFKPLTCGTNQFKEVWTHDGYDTPLPTFCKKAYAWLTYNDQIFLNDQKAMIMNEEGNHACLPNPLKPSECILKSDPKFNEEVTKFNTGENRCNKLKELLWCGMKQMLFRSNQKSSVCNTVIKNNQGIITVPEMPKPKKEE